MMKNSIDCEQDLANGFCVSNTMEMDAPMEVRGEYCPEADNRWSETDIFPVA
jgi:hypothetical protein